MPDRRLLLPLCLIGFRSGVLTAGADDRVVFLSLLYFGIKLRR